MARYIAFLRAINLGAVRKFPKQAIRSCVEAAGFTVTSSASRYARGPKPWTYFTHGVAVAPD